MLADRAMNRRTAHRLAVAMLVILANLANLTPLVAPIRPAWSDDATDARALVDKCKLTLDAFMNDSDMGPPVKSLLKRAKGVLIYPQVLRGAFVFGVSGGSGTFFVHDETRDFGEPWGGPAFYTIGEASFGLQAGGDASQVILIALTDRGVSSLLTTSAKLGGNISIALGPVGAGAEAATQNLSADIVSYSLAKGLYAGISLEGAVVATRDALNEAYYGRKVTPTDILIRHAASNPQADALISTLSQMAGK